MNHVRIQEGATIENPRGYDGLAVGSLERLLQSGAPAKSDPRRRYFYEIEGDAETYYIHISPITGNVTLLAKWLHLPQDCCADPSCAYA